MANERDQAVHVGKVSQIVIYPIKACRGIQVQEAICTFEGWKHPHANIWDRHFSLVNENGRFVNTGTCSDTIMATPRLEGDDMIIEAPDMRVLKIPQVIPPAKVLRTTIYGEQAPGYDCGDEAADWFSEHLNISGLRLLYSAKELEKRNRTRAYSKKDRAVAREHDRVAYHDNATYLLASETSLADLNRKMALEHGPPSEDNANHPMTLVMDRYRANIVLEGVKEPWLEDKFHKIFIGDVSLVNLKLCVRCPTTCVNPKTGVKDPDLTMLDVLSRTRPVPAEFMREPCFGVNLFPDSEGPIRVGDDVYVTYKQ